MYHLHFISIFYHLQIIITRLINQYSLELTYLFVNFIYHFILLFHLTYSFILNHESFQSLYFPTNYTPHFLSNLIILSIYMYY
jgi:hypothetical protein